MPLKTIRKKIWMVLQCSSGRKVAEVPKVDSESTTKVTEDTPAHRM